MHIAKIALFFDLHSQHDFARNENSLPATYALGCTVTTSLQKFIVLHPKFYG